VAGRYAAQAQAIFASAPQDAASDLPAQMAKLCSALASGDVGMPPPQGEPGGCGAIAAGCHRCSRYLLPAK
jgi:hypothetical protein